MRRVCALVLLTVMIFTACAAEAPLPEASFETQMKSEMFTDGYCGVMLQYPVIKNYADKDAASAMNRMIREYVHGMYESSGLSPEEDFGYTYAVSDARVMLASDNFLSVRIGGTISSAFSGNTSYFSYTLNCDIENGTFYTAEDILSDYAALKKQFQKGAFNQTFGYADVHTEIPFSEMISQYKEDYGIYPDVYFDEDGLGFLIDVIPMFDGYAGYTLPYKTARKSMNQQNPFVAHVTNQ